MTTIQLKGGFTTTDIRLDRLPSFDEKSRNFPVRSLRGFSPAPRSRTWNVPMDKRMDQSPEPVGGMFPMGYDGSGCTGFSAATDLSSSPSPVKSVSKPLAVEIYHIARRNDEWPGEAYEGSSVLGACKALQILGYIGSYHWAFGIDDVLGALSSVGPVVFGTVWKEDMFYPDGQGLIKPTGRDAGGHAYMGRSVHYPRSNTVEIKRGTRRLRFKTSEPLIGIMNTWGLGYGIDGEVFISASDMSALLKDWGEARITTSAYKAAS